MVTEIVDLDLGSNSSFKIMTMQGDVASRFIEFHLTYNNEVFDLTGKTVSCRYLKDDKTINTTNLVINDKLNGVCTLNVPYELMENPYIARCELVIKQSNEVLSTIPFTVEVAKSLVKSSIVESSDEFGALNEALWKVEGVKSEIAEIRNFNIEFLTNAKNKWNELSPSPNWVNNDITYDYPLQYKLEGTKVYVRGCIKQLVSTSNTLIATLPVLARPIKLVYSLTLQKGGENKIIGLRVHRNGKLEVIDGTIELDKLLCIYFSYDID